MNLINTDIVPDPYDPQTGDVYEFGDPFVQRLVVEDAPTRDDPRVRYRIDGGVDSNLTTVAQFHRHLAGLTRLRGVGRVREFPPITAEVRKSLVHQLRSTALGVDPVAGDLMRGAATTIVEQAAALDGVACREALEQSKVRLALLQAAVAQALAEDIPDTDDAAATAGLVERLGLLIAALPEVYREREEAEARVVELKRELEAGADNLARLSTLLQTTCTRFATLADAVSPRRPSEDADLIHAATNARQIAYQVKFAIRLLGFEWDDSKADAGHALLQAVRAERKIASDLGMELDSISSMIAPLGVQIPAGFDGDRSTPTSLDLVRWLVVRSGIDLRSQRLTLPEVWEVRDSPTSAGQGANQFTRFKAIADQLRLVASMEDSGNYNPVRSAEAMRTAATAISEMSAMLRSIDETLRASTVGVVQPWSTLELLAKMVQQCEAAHKLRVGVKAMISATKDDDESLLMAISDLHRVKTLAENEREELYAWRDSADAEKQRAVERDAVFHETLATAIGKGSLEASRLGDIIEHLWTAIEGVTGRTGLERDIITAATLKVELERCWADHNRVTELDVAFRTALRLPSDATYEETIARAERLAEHEAKTSRSAITADITAHFTVSSLKEALRIPDATDEKAIKWATYIANRHDFTGAEFDAVIRTLDEPAHERLTWIARFNGGLAGASITLDGRTEFVTGKRAKDLAEALDPRQHQVKTLREQIANLETSLRACEADLDAIRSAYLDVNGTTGTIAEIVGSIRGSCEMQTRIMNLEAIVSDRESTIAMMAERRLLPSEPDDIKKVARVNALCPPGWHVAMARSGIAVFHPQEVVPRTTIMGDSTARIVAEIWRWHMQPTVERLAEFQEGLADILGWSVPQLYDPSGARDMLTAVAGLIVAAKEAE